MKLKEFIESSHIDAGRIRAVVGQLGGWSEAQTAMPDIARYGIDGGFCGFVYYCDTVAFYNRNRHAIIALVEGRASDLGEECAGMVANFTCLRPVDTDARRSIYRALSGCKMWDADTEVANALAWFAGEEVARSFDDTRG
jgi:hypothetical protein